MLRRACSDGTTGKTVVDKARTSQRTSSATWQWGVDQQIPPGTAGNSTPHMKSGCTAAIFTFELDRIDRLAKGRPCTDWWEPTAEAYLNHVPKAQIIAALKEAGPELAGGGVEAMKKDALVSAAASRLAGRRWLPEPLRRSPG